MFPPLAVLALLAIGADTAVVRVNDNLHPAGRSEADARVLHLVAATGQWHPQGPRGKAQNVAAFGEEPGELSTPGPFIRVTAGAVVNATLRNALDYDLTVHGLCARPGPCNETVVKAGTTATFTFTLETPGTYAYWAARGRATLETRAIADTQLGGAIVVDPREGAVPDRVLVVSILTDPDDEAEVGPFVPAINGASWPGTERLQYAVGDRVRFRVVNLSFEPHSMHLHGFHFEVEAEGDGIADRGIAADRRPSAVTEHVDPGDTFAIAWTPTRPGNWLFHCHMLAHITPEPAPGEVTHAGHESDADPTAMGMSGLVMGVTVTGTAPPGVANVMPADRVTMTVSRDENRYGTAPGYRVELPGRDAPKLDDGPVPGPVLIVEQGRPTEVTVENHMKEPTAIHWHGIELESYYDGVPGFGGSAGSVTPPILPGGSFVAKFTAPRAGTFIYHTHWHASAQLAGGLYGALIVMAPGARFDPATDHIAVMGLNGVDTATGPEPTAMNGRSKPLKIVMRAGMSNRLRLVNITANNVSFVVRLVDAGELSVWKPLARDGADLPSADQVMGPARERVGVGETYDVEIPALTPRRLWLEVRRASGRWELQAPVIVE